MIPPKPPHFRQTKGREDPLVALRGGLESNALAWSPEDTLHGLAIVSTVLDDLIASTVAELRKDAEDGRPMRSWSEIGASLGISKQATQQRYGDKEG